MCAQYKYNERAIVYDHKNLLRMWDIAFDGYHGGKDCTYVNWLDDDDMHRFLESTYDLTRPYEGQSMFVMRFSNINNAQSWPSPIVFHDPEYESASRTVPLDGEHQHRIKTESLRVFNRKDYRTQYRTYYPLLPDFSRLHNTKNAGNTAEENETSCNTLAFQGTMRIHEVDMYGRSTGAITEITGNGHLGPDRVGVASIRNGKGVSMGSLTEATAGRIIG